MKSTTFEATTDKTFCPFPNRNRFFFGMASLREGLKKRANYPHFVDEGGGSLHVDKKKFPIVNIINFQNVDKPRGGGQTMWISFLFCFVESRHFLMLFWPFKHIFSGI